MMLIPASQVGYLKLVFCFDILHFLTLKQGNKLVNEIHYELYRSTATKDRKLSPYQLRNDPSTQQTPRQGCGGKPCSSQDCSGRKYLQTLSSSNVQVVKTEEQSVQGSIRETKEKCISCRQSSLSHLPSRCIFPCPAPPRPAGTHALVAGCQPGGRDGHLDRRIESSSFVLLAAVPQDPAESV